MLPVLGHRDEVLKAMEQLSKGPINRVQQDMQTQTEEESKAEDMQAQALLEEECQSKEKQPRVPSEEEEEEEEVRLTSEAEDSEERVPAPTTTDETSAVGKDLLIQRQHRAEVIPACVAAEDTPTISPTEFTEAEDCEESVPAFAAISTASTCELTEGYALTHDSMPVIVKVQGAAEDSSDEQSLASSSSGGKEDLPAAENGSGFSLNFLRNASWSYSQTVADNGFEPLRKTATPRRLRRGRTADLEVNLSACRKALEQLTLERNEHDALTAQSPDQQAGTHPLLEKASSLSARLTDLAAESLECGCHRDVPGAMDVYEQANAYLDAVSDLLQSFTAASLQVEDDE
jgi:hypothetical protein